MADTNHTPGPWRVEESWGAPCIQAKKRPVATVLYHNGSEDPDVEANARLIAAAPDLLAAAEAAAAACDCTNGLIVTGATPFLEYGPCPKCATLRAAIAKARGEER